MIFMKRKDMNESEQKSKDRVMRCMHDVMMLQCSRRRVYIGG